MPSFIARIGLKFLVCDFFVFAILVCSLVIGFWQFSAWVHHRKFETLLFVTIVSIWSILGLFSGLGINALATNWWTVLGFAIPFWQTVTTWYPYLLVCIFWSFGSFQTRRGLFWPPLFTYRPFEIILPYEEARNLFPFFPRQSDALNKLFVCHIVNFLNYVNDKEMGKRRWRTSCR